MSPPRPVYAGIGGVGLVSFAAARNLPRDGKNEATGRRWRDVSGSGLLRLVQIQRFDQARSPWVPCPSPRVDHAIATLEDGLAA